MSLIELMGFWHGTKGVGGRWGGTGGDGWERDELRKRSAAAFLCTKAMSGLSSFSLVLPDRTGGTSLYVCVSCIHEPL